MGNGSVCSSAQANDRLHAVSDVTRTFLRDPLLRWGILALCMAVMALYAKALQSLPSAPPDNPSPSSVSWPSAAVPSSVDWEVFRRSAVVPQGVAGELGKRFRLAGTFFSFSEVGGGDENFCKAILDDVQRKEQYLVKEGDSVADAVQVVRIYRDRIVLRRGSQEEELWLSFNAGGGPGGAGSGPQPLGTLASAPALEVNRFGKRVGEARWVLSREELMNYYDELKDDPERIAALYVSMKPEYVDGAISGYVLDMQGENEFFEAAGLRNGDIVRKVNSLQMSSQKRAEYFIGEFAKNRLNAVVLDVERDGQDRKLIYLIR